MKRSSVLDHQSVKRVRKRGFFLFKTRAGQLGFGLIKIFLFLVGLGGLSLALISGSQFLTSSPYFRLRNIVVTGVNDDLREELIKISGLKQGESLFSLDPAVIRRKIETHPWVRSVFLRKRFPHTLYINAENEEPVAIVLLERMYLMGREGVIFKEFERDDSVDFPVITGLSTGGTRNGAYLKGVASFLDALCSVDPRLSVKSLSEIHVEEDGALTIYFNQLPFKVFFGKDGFIRKIHSLTDIIRHLRAAHRLYQVRSIDLNYRDSVVVAFTGEVV